MKPSQSNVFYLKNGRVMQSSAFEWTLRKLIYYWVSHADYYNLNNLRDWLWYADFCSGSVIDDIDRLVWLKNGTYSTCTILIIDELEEKLEAKKVTLLAVDDSLDYLLL